MAAERTPPLPRAFWLLWWGALINRLGDFVLPFLAIYLTTQRHLSPEQVGLVLALFGAGQIAAGPVGGLLADRLGRRRALLVATVLGAAGMLHLGAARALPHIAIAMVVLGFVGVLYRPAQQAAVADVTTPENRQRAFAIVYWAVNLGFGVSVIAAGELSHFGFGWLFVGDAATTLAYGAVIWALFPETRPAVEKPRLSPGAVLRRMFLPFGDPALRVFLPLCFLGVLAFWQAPAMLPLDLQRRGVTPEQFGRLMAINGFLIVALQLSLTRLSQRWPRRWLMAISTLLIGAGLGLNAWVHSIPGYAAGIAIWTFGEMLQMPAISAIVADLSPPHARGAYQGAPALLFAVASCLSPLVGGAVLQHFGSRALWSGALGLCVVAALGELITGKHWGLARSAELRGSGAAAETAGSPR